MQLTLPLLVYEDHSIPELAIRVKALDALKELRPFIAEDKQEKFDALTSLFSKLEAAEAA